MRIYIKHGQRSLKDSLSNDSKIRARRTAIGLAKDYGIPKAIICSPFKLCIQTGQQMAIMLSNVFNVRINIRVYTDLFKSGENAEYLHRIIIHNDYFKPMDNEKDVYWFIVDYHTINGICSISGYLNKRKIYNLGGMIICKKRNNDYYFKFFRYCNEFESFDLSSFEKVRSNTKYSYDPWKDIRNKQLQVSLM